MLANKITLLAQRLDDHNRKTAFSAADADNWAQFHGSAYRKHRVGAYGSREFCAYGKPVSRVSDEFWRLHVRTPHYLAQKFVLASKRGIMIVSA